MNWTALIPLKPLGLRKRRLADHLPPAAREELVNAMFDHVVEVVDRWVERVFILGARDGDGSRLRRIADAGRGLNAELTSARETIGASPLVVIHADLPLLSDGDLEALLGAAEASGLALAPDRHGAGTNAVAIADGRDFSFRFGARSFERHRADTSGACSIVKRRGLEVDCDEIDDLHLATAYGYVFSVHGVREDDARKVGIGPPDSGI